MGCVGGFSLDWLLGPDYVCFVVINLCFCFCWKCLNSGVIIEENPVLSAFALCGLLG